MWGLIEQVRELKQQVKDGEEDLLASAREVMWCYRRIAQLEKALSLINLGGIDIETARNIVKEALRVQGEKPKPSSR